MEPSAISIQVKELVASVTGISPESIADSAMLVDDLGLDSLAVLEIAVDIESAFKIRATEEELQAIRSVPDIVALIVQHNGVEVA